MNTDVIFPLAFLPRPTEVIVAGGMAAFLVLMILVAMYLSREEKKIVRKDVMIAPKTLREEQDKQIHNAMQICADITSRHLKEAVLVYHCEDWTLKQPIEPEEAVLWVWAPAVMRAKGTERKRVVRVLAYLLLGMEENKHLSLLEAEVRVERRIPLYSSKQGNATVLQHTLANLRRRIYLQGSRNIFERILNPSPIELMSPPASLADANMILTDASWLSRSRSTREAKCLLLNACKAVSEKDLYNISTVTCLRCRKKIPLQQIDGYLCNDCAKKH